METSAIVTQILGVITDLTADAAPIIAAAIGFSAMFFGAKLLWTKFKGMSKG